MYRDLKPENVLLDENGNACLADFGISKILDQKQSTKSFVGTPEYVAPEIILQKGHNKSVDIWCFGILLYEMAFGIPPFYNKNQNMMLNWIVKLEPTFPKSIKISDELQQLIGQVGLLVLAEGPRKESRLQRRLGNPLITVVQWRRLGSC
jgi:serum/glucocorticoid-regulated kinase 2